MINLNTFLNNSINISILLILVLRDFGLKKLSISSKNEIIIDSYYTNVKVLLELFSKISFIEYNRLSDMVVYDRPEYKLRYLLIYVLTSPLRDSKLRLRSAVSPEYTILPSVYTTFYSSNWSEREVMDMYGIKFLGHNDLRRILGDYGFWGFPGRKDFPLVGNYSYLYTINFLRVFKIRGTVKNFWNLLFQKSLYK